MQMNMQEVSPPADRFPLHFILLASAVIAILISLYTYLYARAYDFLVEAPCSVVTAECYVRDCSEGDCPPNNLSSYRVFSVPASAFDACTDNSCINICSAAGGPCTEIACSEQEDVECLGPLAPRAPSL
ncbi:MAG: hypothetical protein AAB665_01800 [Patescibacteria group bacterium]